MLKVKQSAYQFYFKETSFFWKLCIDFGYPMPPHILPNLKADKFG